jgi:hypothetical protein
MGHLTRIYLPVPDHSGVTLGPFGNQTRSMQAGLLGNGIAAASTSAVFSERWIPHGTCAKLPPTDAKVSANTILQ